MAIQTTFESNNNLVRITFTGKTSPEDILQSTLLEHQHPDFRPGMHSLSDFSAAKFVDINFDIVHTYNAHMAEIQKIRGHCRWAMVSSSLVNYGILRMFSMLNSDSLIEMKVFRSEDEAWGWIQESG